VLGFNFFNFRNGRVLGFNFFNFRMASTVAVRRSLASRGAFCRLG
jgi:hypothetical protein